MIREDRLKEFISRIATLSEESLDHLIYTGEILAARDSATHKIKYNLGTSSILDAESDSEP